ncbi:Imm70 family immunity protein [Roseateles sp. BYS180W]|uniref:Imm70 family immunity protein n=1 Tax=Roseateles rivi TaxID=3299028 RepID=A0ABW7FTN0_9BURK
MSYLSETVHIQVGDLVDDLGTPALFKAFLTNVARHGEPLGPGSVYPHLVKRLWQQGIDPDEAAAACLELAAARRVLQRLPASQLWWDASMDTPAPAQRPGASLDSCFVTPEGLNYFDVLDDALRAAAEENTPARLQMQRQEVALPLALPLPLAA